MTLRRFFAAFLNTWPVMIQSSRTNAVHDRIAHNPQL
jgi:hypothetical protein